MAKGTGKTDWAKRGGRTQNYPVVTPPGLTTPAQPEKAGNTWANWAPYFRGLGVVPVGNYLTATSPALRNRLVPNALTAMQNYFSTSPRSWADYLTYSNPFMSRTPIMGGRYWNPARWR